MFKISHEVPNCLLNKSLDFNDYDYILFHLLKKSPIYLNFSLNHPERYKIMDNSAYEYYINGDSFNFKEYVELIKIIKPNEVIIPDSLMNTDKTIEMFEKWYDKYNNLIDPGIKRMVVVQGNSLQEWERCHNFYKKYLNKFDRIGISFGYRFLNKLGDVILGVGEAYRYAWGRKILIQKLVNSGNLIKDKTYHLLGNYWAGEFTWYTKPEFNFITTIDTSIPIKLGIEEIKLDDLNFYQEKPKIIMDDFIESKLNNRQINTIMYNIKKFKEILYGY